MLTKNLQLVKGTVIVFEVLQIFWEHVLQYVDKLDENSDCGDDDGLEEADDDGSTVE